MPNVSTIILPSFLSMRSPNNVSEAKIIPQAILFYCAPKDIILKNSHCIYKQRTARLPGTCTSPRCAHCYLLCPQICTWHPLRQLSRGTAAQTELESQDSESQWTRSVCQGRSSADHLAGCCQLLLQTHTGGDQMPPWCDHSDVPVVAARCAVCAQSISASN